MALAFAIYVAFPAATVGAAPIDYDEAVDGPLPTTPAPGPLTPDSALALDVGTNRITGTAQWGGTIPTTFDTALLDLGEGLEIDSITLSAAQVDGAAILNRIRAELFRYDAAVTSSSSIRFELLDMPLAATDLYVADLPIGEAGLYGVSIAGYSGNTNNSFALVDYTWSIVVTPEPGTATLLVVGLIGLSLHRRGVR